MKRSTPLRADPETTKAWIARSRRNQVEALKRSTGLKRTGLLKRKARVRPINRERRDREFARCYGSEERVLSIKALPCSVPGCTNRPCENAHTVGGGMGRKAGWETVAPLCRSHHRRFHELGSNALFAPRYGVDLVEVAERLAVEIPPHRVEAA